MCIQDSENSLSWTSIVLSTIIKTLIRKGHIVLRLQNCTTWLEQWQCYMLDLCWWNPHTLVQWKEQKKYHIDELMKIWNNRKMNEWMWVISPIGEKVEWVHSMTWIEFKFEIQKLLLNDIHWKKVRECSGWKNVTITTRIRTLYGSVYNNEIYYFLSWLCFHFMTKLTEIVFILFVFVEYPDSQLLMNIESINLQFRNVILLSNFMLTNRACTLLKKAPDI